jgi:hypothetical protein
MLCSTVLQKRDLALTWEIAYRARMSRYCPRFTGFYPYASLSCISCINSLMTFSTNKGIYLTRCRFYPNLDSTSFQGR